MRFVGLDESLVLTLNREAELSKTLQSAHQLSWFGVLIQSVSCLCAVSAVFVQARLQHRIRNHYFLWCCCDARVLDSNVLPKPVRLETCDSRRVSVCAFFDFFCLGLFCGSGKTKVELGQVFRGLDVAPSINVIEFDRQLSEVSSSQRSR
mmetsp:Transcript_52570/g.140064  ORF Transcript_52570/g.140064 Transcript_52570/m.140064 type:complete len:150 (-) Transcript_52570:99-548(-)